MKARICLLLLFFVGASATIVHAQNDTTGDSWEDQSGNLVTTSGFTGNVGIGTQAPNANVAVHIQTDKLEGLWIKQTSGTSHTGLTLLDNDGNRASIMTFPVNHGSGTMNNSIGIIAKYGKHVFINTSTNATLGETKMAILNNGRVGIGTNNPLNIFNIDESSPDKDYLIFSRDGVKRYAFELSGNEKADDGALSDNSGAEFWLKSFDDAGNYVHAPFKHIRKHNYVVLEEYVGIGTWPTGQQRFVIKGHSDAATSTHFKVTDNADNVDFLINGAGQVLIGSNNPGFSSTEFKLAVDGGIYAEKVKVQLSEDWADFVFEEDYALRPLAEVEAFVKENKHLPEIPSASEVEQEGIDLAEMNSKLLQKVEELTLYIIEQEKRIQALEAKSSEKE